METPTMLMATSDAVAMDDTGNDHVKAEPPATTIAALPPSAATVKAEAPAAAAEQEDTNAAEADINAKKRDAASVKQLKLRLFQQLTRRQQHKHAWPQYWRALQQFLTARLSLEEFHCIVEILLGPDLLELHNAFIIAILNEAQANSAADRDSNDDKAAVLRGEDDEDGSDLKTAVKKEEAVLTTTETPPVKNEADPNEGDSSHVKADLHDHSSSSEQKKRPFSTHISSPDDERAVKKLLHFANSKRDTPEKQHADQQSAELLIGLGNFGSRAASSKSSSASSQ